MSKVYLTGSLLMDNEGRICCGNSVVMESARKPFALTAARYDCEDGAGLTLIKDSVVIFDNPPVFTSSRQMSEALGDHVFVVFAARHDGFRRDHVFYERSADFVDMACMNIGKSAGADLVIVRTDMSASKPVMFLVDRMDGSQELYVVNGASCERLEGEDIDDLASGVMSVSGIDKTDAVGLVATLRSPNEWGEFGVDISFYEHNRAKWVETLWRRKRSENAGTWRETPFNAFIGR